MRCSNCGWMGAENSTQCEKCKAPLNGNPVAPSSERSQPPRQGDGISNATVIGRKAGMPAWDGSAPVAGKPTDRLPSEDNIKPLPPPEKPKRPASTDRICSKCDYSNDPSARFCVSCGNSFTNKSSNGEHERRSKDANTDNSSSEPVRRPPVKPQKANLNATVNPWSNKKNSSFSLRVIPREGERIEAEMHFDGDSVELNRSVLEPSNNSITSKVQAQIEYHDGNWYISNKSAQQTTFIRISGQTLLQKGDVILLGDRMFEFDC